MNHGIMTCWVFGFQLWNLAMITKLRKKDLKIQEGNGSMVDFFHKSKKSHGRQKKSRCKKKHKCIQIRIQNQTNPKWTEVSVSMIQYTYPKEKTIVLAPSEYLIISHTILLFALLHKGRVFWPSFQPGQELWSYSWCTKLEFCHCLL